VTDGKTTATSGSHSPLPQRRRPAHPRPVQRPNEPVILLVTVCIRDREPVLANDAVHAALRTAWSDDMELVVGNYVIMPDHLHLFCAPGVSCQCEVKNWCARWKGCVSRHVPRVKGRWLSDCWDTQMRSQEHYLRKLAYVLDNPARVGLVERVEEWPFEGRMVDLPWVL
jgi:putative transposase